MSFNWKDYLTFAENLRNNPDQPGPSEAALRSATSRAYYSAFQAAFQFGKAENFSPTYQGDDHRKVRDYFRETAASKRKNDARRKISLQLKRLSDFRRQVDYDSILEQKPENIAYYAIRMAEIVFKSLEELE